MGENEMPNVPYNRKELWRSIAAQPWWEHIPPRMRTLAGFYYGFDVPGDATRTVAEAAALAGMKCKSAGASLTIIKQFCKHFDPNLPFPKVVAKRPSECRGFSMSETTRMRWEGQRKEEKKIWQSIIEQPWWEDMIPSDQRLIITYMGLDLPGEDIRTMHQAAELLGTTHLYVGARYGRVKTFCKHFDPALPWSVKSVQPPRSRVKRHREEKSIMLRMRETPAWAQLSENERSVVACYYGFDFPDGKIRGLKKSALQLNVSTVYIVQVVDRVKGYIKYVNPEVPLLVRPRPPSRKEIRRGEEKALFLQLAKTDLWGCLSNALRRILACYYGFDLPDEQRRSVAEVSARLDYGPGSVRTLIWVAKATLKRHDSSLPFRVAPFKENSETIAGLSLLDIFKRQLFAEEDLDDAHVAHHALRLQRASSASKNEDDVSESEEARVALFIAGMRDVLPIAFAWFCRKIGSFASFGVLDYIQEGGIGLWQSVSGFVGETRENLSEFARKAARDEIKLALRRSGVSVSVGSEFTTLARKLSRTWNAFEKYAGCAPDFEELVRAMGEEREVVAAVLDHMRISISPSRSLDAPAYRTDEGDSPALVETIADVKVASADDLLEHRAWELRERWLGESAEKALGKALSPLEQYVLRLRYGFDGDALTEQAIADMLKTTVSMIETIETEAITKLRTDKRVLTALARFVERPSVTSGTFRLSEVARIRAPKLDGVVHKRKVAVAEKQTHCSIGEKNMHGVMGDISVMPEDAEVGTESMNPTCSISAEAVVQERASIEIPEDDDENEFFFDTARFRAHEHRWLGVAVYADAIEKELQELRDTALPYMRELTEQGLIPARVWYRKREKKERKSAVTR